MDREVGEVDLHVVGEDDRPLRVVLLHGHGGSPEAMLPAALAVADATGAQVVLPRGPEVVGEDHAWWQVGGRATDAALDAVAAVVAGGGPRPTVVVGFSQGAAMAVLAAVERPRPALAGLVAVAGFLPDELADRPSTVVPELGPVLVVHGAADEVVDPLHGRVLARWCGAHGAVVERVVHEGGHEWTPEVDAAVAGWLRPLVVAAGDAHARGGI